MKPMPRYIRHSIPRPPYERELANSTARRNTWSPSAHDLARVEQFGEVATRHLLVVETKGSMTLGDSLTIRRELFDDKVRTTANLFGRSGSGALFYRNVPSGQPRNDNDPVELTEEGKRIAGLWRQRQRQLDA